MRGQFTSSDHVIHTLIFTGGTNFSIQQKWIPTIENELFDSPSIAALNGGSAEHKQMPIPAFDSYRIFLR
jgi:hypothetical protein